MEAGDFPTSDEKGLRHPLDAIGSDDFVGWVEGIGVGGDIFFDYELYATVASDNSEGMIISSLAMVLAS